MSIVMSTVTNQYGNEVIEQEYYLENGLWMERYLNCRSSSWEGLGTCQCNSHNTYDSWPVSREEVRKAIESRITELSEEERADLLDDSLSKRIDEKFGLLGFTLGEVETWAADCYKMDLNPLPTLREHLKSICDVGFMYDQDGAFWESEKDTLVCRLHKGDNPDDTYVSLDVCEGVKPEPDSEAYLLSAIEVQNLFKTEMEEGSISSNLWNTAKRRGFFSNKDFLDGLFDPSDWEKHEDGYMYKK